MGSLALARSDAYRTGALNKPVKTEPLPVGFYWIDVIDSEENDANIATFYDWLTLHANTVVLVREEQHNMSKDWNIFETDPKRVWALFEVKSPTRWDQQLSLGWPNEGTADMVEGDTIQRPDPEPTIFDSEFEWPTWLKYTVYGIGGLAAVAVVYSVVRK